MIDLFKMFGIKIRAEWTVLFLVFFFSDYGVWGILAILAVIILHELGHALMVQARKGYVDSIILQGFGGVTLYQGIHHPTDKVLVSAAGPLVNLVTAGILYNFGFLDASSGQLSSFHPFLGPLCIFSLILGIFNCLPVLPLDGGHILEGLLALKYDERKARLWSLHVTRVGAVILLLIALMTGWLILMIFAGLFFFLAHKELSQMTLYSPSAGMWQTFKESQQEKKEQKQQESDLAMKARVDQILAKISKDGMSSLTKEEREFLNKASDHFK